MKIPLRFQITVLLVVFVAGVAAVSFQTTFGFLERDKLSTLRAIQTDQVSISSRELRDRILRFRNEMRETAIRLLDPSRGNIQLESSVWSWIDVQGKSWKSPDFKETLPDGHASVPSGFRVFRETSDTHLRLELPIEIRENNKTINVLVRGRVNKRALLGDAGALSRDPIQGVLIDVSSLNPSSEKTSDFLNSMWLGSDKGNASLAAIFASLTVEQRKSFLTPVEAKLQEFPVDNKKYLAAWSTVAVPSTAMNLMLVTVVDQNSVLQGFRRTKVELAFWSLLLLGFGMIAASLLGRGISKPIENLVSAAKILETGNFKVRVAVTRKDEVGDLGTAFNHMGQALEDRERALSAAQSALIQNEKLAALGTLSAGIAHEVKNPLAGILGHADMTANQIKKLPPEMQASFLKHIETIQKETKRCRGIIDNLMRFSRKEESEAQKLEHVDLETVACEAILLVEHPMNMQKVKIEKNFSEVAQIVHGNANQIEQVVLNMIQNAGHAMPEGGVVSVSTMQFADPASAEIGRLVAYAHPDFQGPFMRICIKDAGIGMSEEVQKRIFEPFFTTKPKGVGTGLGLSVTMSILADHKARISLNSAPGKGTEFLIDFMSRGPRTQDVMSHLTELRARAAGGAKLSTDVGAVPVSMNAPSVNPSEMEIQGSFGESPAGVSHVTESVTRSTAGVLPVRPPIPKQVASSASANQIAANQIAAKQIATKQFVLRKPSSRKDG